MLAEASTRSCGGSRGIASKGLGLAGRAMLARTLHAPTMLTDSRYDARFDLARAGPSKLSKANGEEEAMPSWEISRYRPSRSAANKVLLRELRLDGVRCSKDAPVEDKLRAALPRLPSLLGRITKVDEVQALLLLSKMKGMYGVDELHLFARLAPYGVESMTAQQLARTLYLYVTAHKNEPAVMACDTVALAPRMGRRLLELLDSELSAPRNEHAVTTACSLLYDCARMRVFDATSAPEMWDPVMAWAEKQLAARTMGRELYPGGWAAGYLLSAAVLAGGDLRGHADFVRQVSDVVRESGVHPARRGPSFPVPPLVGLAVSHLCPDAGVQGVDVAGSYEPRGPDEDEPARRSYRRSIVRGALQSLGVAFVNEFDPLSVEGSASSAALFIPPTAEGHWQPSLLSLLSAARKAAVQEPDDDGVRRLEQDLREMRGIVVDIDGEGDVLFDLGRKAVVETSWTSLRRRVLWEMGYLYVNIPASPPTATSHAQSDPAADLQQVAVRHIADALLQLAQQGSSQPSDEGSPAASGPAS